MSIKYRNEDPEKFQYIENNLRDYECYIDNLNKNTRSLETKNIYDFFEYFDPMFQAQQGISKFDQINSENRYERMVELFYYNFEVIQNLLGIQHNMLNQDAVNYYHRLMKITSGLYRKYLRIKFNRIFEIKNSDINSAFTLLTVFGIRKDKSKKYNIREMLKEQFDKNYLICSTHEQDDRINTAVKALDLCYKDCKEEEIRTNICEHYNQLIEKRLFMTDRQKICKDAAKLIAFYFGDKSPTVEGITFDKDYLEMIKSIKNRKVLERLQLYIAEMNKDKYFDYLVNQQKKGKKLTQDEKSTVNQWYLKQQLSSNSFQYPAPESCW